MHAGLVLPAARTVDAIVFPAGRDAGVVGCDEAAVGDGDTVGVTGKIAQHLRRPAIREGSYDSASARIRNGKGRSSPGAAARRVAPNARNKK
jgi:hypothetical protein